MVVWLAILSSGSQRWPITFGDGSQTRSFCYVDDLVEGIGRFMALDNQGQKTTGPLNIGNPTEFTIQELAELIKDKVGP